LGIVLCGYSGNDLDNKLKGALIDPDSSFQNSPAIKKFKLYELMKDNLHENISDEFSRNTKKIYITYNCVNIDRDDNFSVEWFVQKKSDWDKVGKLFLIC